MPAARGERNRFLFRTRNGNPLNRDNFRGTAIRPALPAAGLAEPIRTYDLGHSHAPRLVGLGTDQVAVARRLGHSDPPGTLRDHGHLLAGAQGRLGEQLDAPRLATAGEAVEGSLVAVAGFAIADDAGSGLDGDPTRRSRRQPDPPSRTVSSRRRCPRAPSHRVVSRIAQAGWPVCRCWPHGTLLDER